MVPTYRVCITSRCDVIKRRAPVYGYGSLVIPVICRVNVASQPAEGVSQSVVRTTSTSIMYGGAVEEDKRDILRPVFEKSSPLRVRVANTPVPACFWCSFTSE
jgi:hypothetical protein